MTTVREVLKEANVTPRYRLGEHSVHIFYVCGEMFEIIDPDGSVLCRINCGHDNPREQAQAVVDKLNMYLERTDNEGS